MIICAKCGQTFGCTLGGVLHALATHNRLDVHIPKDLTGEDGVNCLACLLANTVPLDEYYRTLKEKA